MVEKKKHRNPFATKHYHHHHLAKTTTTTTTTTSRHGHLPWIHQSPVLPTTIGATTARSTRAGD
jgi:hypothetical protein